MSCCSATLRLSGWRGALRSVRKCLRLTVAMVLGLCAAACPLAGVFAGEPVAVTSDGLLKLAPSFADAGAAIVYSVHDIPNRVTLFKRDLETGAMERLLPNTENHQFDAELSPDGRYLVYSRTLSSPQMQLVIYDRREKKESVHNPRGARSTIRGAVVTPDSQLVVFSQSGPGGQQIVRTNMKAEELTYLTRSPGINISPAVSPDGRAVAFSSSRDGNLEIYVMNIDGSEQRRVTRSPTLDMHPAWSPDGRRLAFTSSRDGNYEIYVVTVARSADEGDGEATASTSAGKTASQPAAAAPPLKAFNLTQHPERDDFAVWHPDGRRVLAVSERRGRFDLYLFEVPAEEVGGGVAE